MCDILEISELRVQNRPRDSAQPGTPHPLRTSFFSTVLPPIHAHDKGLRAYDALDRLLTETDPRGGVTAYAYDAADNRTGLTDPAGNGTAFAYDALGRRTTETDPLGQVTAYGYDGAGRVASVTDPLLRQRAYGYDALDRVTSERWHAPGGALVQEQTFSYDANDNLLTATDPDGNYAIAYDELNRPVTVAEPFGLSLAFAYDAAGNRTQVTDSRGGATASTYDALGRLTAREQSVNGQPSLRATWGFSPEGDATGEARQSWSGSAWQTVGTTERAFDDLGRLTDLTHRDGGGAVLATYGYGYDAADRLTSETIDGVTRGYGYDAANQLVSDNGAALGYDANGNRTNAGYVTGPGNRLLSDGTWTYTYDAAGNLVKKSQGANAETWTYAYDHDNRLVSASRAATDGGTADATVSYAYDAFGNRIGRDEWSASGGSDSQRFGYNGWDTAKPRAVGGEGFDAWADLDGSGSLTMRRLYGAGFDDLVAGRDGAGSARWYLSDRLGSVRHIADGTGAVIGSRDYGAFGQLLGGAGVEDRYGYTGREWDAALGLQYTRARMYDPATGRFTSADPAGFAADDSNLYRYVNNSPTNATDPSGRYLIFPNQEAADAWVAWLGKKNVWSVGLSFATGERLFLDMPKTEANVKAFKEAVRAAYDEKTADAIINAALGGDLGGLNVIGYQDYGVLYTKDAGRPLTDAELGAAPRERPGFATRAMVWGILTAYQAGSAALGIAESVGEQFRKAPGQIRNQLQRDADQLKNQADQIAEAVDSPEEIQRRLEQAVRKGVKHLFSETLHPNNIAAVGDAIGLFKDGEWVAGGVKALEVADHVATDIIPDYRGGKTHVAALQHAIQTGDWGEGLDATAGLAELLLKQLPPCKVADSIQSGLRGYHAFRVGTNAVGVAEDLAKGDTAGAWRKVQRAWAHFKAWDGPCFAAGTPVLTPEGERPIEQLRPGDLVLSRPEGDPDGPVEAKAVEEAFVRAGTLFHLHVGGEVIRTTPEHPFYVRGRGWVAAGELRVGDLLSSHDGRWVPVEDLLDTGEEGTVYNLRVADSHTYFVGCHEWGFSVWAHNSCIERQLRTLRSELGEEARRTLDAMETAYNQNIRFITRGGRQLGTHYSGESDRGPVLTVLKDLDTGQLYYGQNYKAQIVPDLHPELQRRLNEAIANGLVPKDRARGLAGSHSEIDAINQALHAREGLGMNTTNFSRFALYNIMAKDYPNSPARSAKPRCDACEEITQDVIALNW